MITRAFLEHLMKQRDKALLQAKEAEAAVASPNDLTLPLEEQKNTERSLRLNASRARLSLSIWTATLDLYWKEHGHEGDDDLPF